MEETKESTDWENNISINEAADNYYTEKSEENLDSLICACNKLICYFVKLYGDQKFNEDLYQAGSEGLLKAIKRFDFGNGCSFTTYAGSLIIGEIRHYIRKETAYYRPKTVENLQEKASLLIQNRFLSTGEVPSLDDIADSLNLKESGVYEVMKTGLVPLEEVDLSRITSARYEAFKLPIEDRILLEQALTKLTQTQRKVIDLLFYKDMKQAQAAKKMDLNQRKVSRILNTGIESLRKNIG